MTQPSSKGVLLLSDNRQDSELLRAWLEPKRGGGFVLAEMLRPEAAFAPLNLTDVAVIVIDITHLDGKVFPLLNALWAQAGGRPIIALSENEQTGFVAQVLSSGARRYLPRRLLTEELLITTLQDASGGRQRQELLAQAEQFYMTVFEDFPAPVWRSRADGQCDYFNRAWLDFTGRTPDQELGSTWAEGLHPEDIGRCQQIYREAFTARQPYEAEYRLRRHDGEYRWMLDQAGPVYNDEGEFAGYIGVCFDITDRKRTEQVRRESEEYLNTLMDSIAAGVFLIDETTHTIADVNRTALALIGATKTQVLGKLCHEFVCPAEQGCCPISDLKQEVDHSDRVLLTAKGKKIPILKSVIRLMRKGRPYLLESFVELTKIKQVEQELRYRLSLEELVSSISTNFVKLSSPEIDNAINDTLKAIGAFVGVDRAYVFQLSDDGVTVSNTHEWCAKGIESVIDKLQGIPVAPLSWWMERLRRSEMICIPRVADLPPEAAAEKEILQLQGIQSLVVVPLVFGSARFGFLGFDSVESEKSWQEEDIAPLKIIGEILANAITRQRVEAALHASQILQKATLEATADGILVVNQTGKVLLNNARFAEMWRIPEELRTSQDDRRLLDYVVGQLQDPAAFLAKVQELYASDRESLDYIEFLDGRVFERFSNPLFQSEMVVGRVWSFRDVTERRRAEENLREMERILNRTSAVVFLWRAAEGWPVEVVSDNILQFGYTPEELISGGTAFAAMVHPEDLPRVGAEVEEYSRRGVPEFTQEYRLLTKIGEARWVEDRTWVRRDEAGKITHYQGIVIDITERKRAEQALQEQSRFLQTMMDALPTPVFYKDIAGHYLGCNKAFEILLGKSQQEIIGQTIFDLVSPEGSEFNAQKDRELLEAGGLQGYEHYLIDAKGAHRLAMFNKAIFHNADGGLGGIIGAITDITERKQAEEALTTSREQLKAVLENVGIGISLLSPEMRVMDLNRKMREWFPEISVDDHPLCYQAYNNPPREGPCSYCPCVLTLRDGQVHEAITDTPTEGGIIHYRIISTPVRDAAGKIIAVIEMVDDITKQKRAEEALQQSEEQLRLKLDSVLSPDAELGEQELANIIDSRAIQSLMDDFYAVTKMGCAVVDLKGNVLVATGWQEICTKFHRVHPKTLQGCLESDLELSRGVAPGEFRAYRCKNNLWDIVTPIFIGEKHVGNVFTGQFFYEDEMPDYEYFAAQAKKYGFDKAEYLAALDKVPRWSREKVASLIKFYAKLGDQISRLSYGNLKLARVISDLKRAEVRLNRQLEFLQQLIDAIPAPIFFKDCQGLYLGCNKAYENFLGRARENIIGKTVYEMAPKELADKYDAMDQQLFQEGGVQVYEASVIQADGYRREVIFNKAPFQNADGGMGGIIGAILDVTELKRAEQTLREKELQNKAILDNIPDIAWLKDKESRFLAVNEAFARNSGVKAEAMVGKTDLDYYPREIAEAYRADDREIMKLGRQKRLEEPITDGEGRIIWLETIKTPVFDENGEVIGTSGIARDITKRKQAEEQIRESLEKFSDALVETVNALAATVETRDPYTAGHQQRVSRLACAIAGRMGLAADRIEAIRVSAIVHDIGKISTPVEILNKPGSLTPVEMGIIREHPKVSYEILKKIPFPWPAAQITLQHHERIDGSGYPAGLKGEEILLEARIIAVADVVEAMSTHRPFRPAKGLEEAQQEIRQGQGRLYDSAAVEACLELFRDGEIIATFAGD